MTERIYLDNAATTPLDPLVIEAMVKVMREDFGNPSSIHWFGRKSRSLIENARKSIAALMNCAPGEIFFTSGGTEADNMALIGAVNDLGVKRIITSAIEHHAVLHTAQHLAQEGKIQLDLVKLDADGSVDFDDLERLLDQKIPTLVTLMHGNNEVSNLLDLDRCGQLCKDKGAFFHSDTVQTIGHYRFDLQKQHLDFLNAGAHKFHGPKGVGFIYISNRVKLHPLLYGGAQERNMRGGTENLYGIVGMARALELAYNDLEAHQKHIQGLKDQFINGLKKRIPGIRFNGASGGAGLYTVCSVHFPPTDQDEMMLFNLDIRGLATSGGSACSSGSNQGSHVLQALGVNQERANVRFSFSRFNTVEEIEETLNRIERLLVKKST